MQSVPSMQEMELVSLFREAFDETEWFGYVAAENDDLVVLHSVSDRYDLDGYRVFRWADIEAVDDDFDRKEIVERALDIKNLEPAPVPWLRLDSMHEAILSILENEPVVVIEREAVSPEECEIGRIQMDGDGAYSLLLMTTQAEWELDNRVFRYEDITQVSFGGEYERTLAQLAGPWPSEPA